MAAPVIPGFRLLRPLGRGGMGAVFVVEPEGMPGAVRALKVLTVNAGANGDERRERFVREGDILARLHGAPGIVRVHGAGAHGDLLWLCMEHVDGRDLARVLEERGRLPWAEATRIVRGVALGLAEAHARGVIHRDVKPANVILDRAGAAALVDFGVAHATDLERLTRTGVSVGTPVYFSPEQATGRPLDGKTDVYSLGVLLYELLTGELPFADDVPFPALLDAIQREVPSPPSALTSQVPAELDRAVLAALAKAPEQRPDARAWAATLDACLDLEGATGAGPGRTAARRTAVALAVVAVVGVVLVVALRSKPAPPPVEPAPVTILEPPALEVAEAAVTQAATAPDDAAALERAAALVASLPPGPARRLQELRLDFDRAMRPGSSLTLVDMFDLLARVRALSAADATPAAVRTQARLLEGEMLTGVLGWHDTAVPALSSVRDALAASSSREEVEEGRGTWSLRLATGGIVVPQDLAARVLLARATSQRLDGQAALAAAEDAAARARELDLRAVQVATESMRAEALALLGRNHEAREALDGATALLSRLEPGEQARVRVFVDALGARFARWGLGGELIGLRVDNDVALEYLIEGEAELHRAAPVDVGTYPALGRLDPLALARARRALRLAVASALRPKIEANAWALLARSHLLEEDLAGADDALARARSALPELTFEVRRMDALVRAAKGEGAAVEELRAGLRQIATGSGRLPVKAADLLAAAADALWVLKDPQAEFAVLDELWRAAEALRLPPSLRERIGEAALVVTRQSWRGRRVPQVEQALANLRAEVAELVPLVEAALAERQGVMDTPDTAKLLAVIARCPLDPSFYEALWTRGAELQPWAFDVLSLAFELRPSVAPALGNQTRRRNRDPQARVLATEVLNRHLRTDELAPDLPVRRNDEMRFVTVVLVAHEAGLELPPPTFIRATGAALHVLERLPRSPSGWLALGYGRLELGDFGGAVVAFERAATLPVPFESSLAIQRALPRFYSALARAALGDQVAAAKELREVIAAGFKYHERLKDPRLAAVPGLEALEIEARANDRGR